MSCPARRHAREKKLQQKLKKKRKENLFFSFIYFFLKSKNHELICAREVENKTWLQFLAPSAT